MHMSLGAGIAIAAPWGCVAAALLSPKVTGQGVAVAMVGAMLTTIIVALI